MKPLALSLLLALLAACLIGCHQTDEPPVIDHSPENYVYNGTLGQTAYDTSRMPVFSHPPGVYHDAIVLSITSPDPSLTIHFTVSCAAPSIYSNVYSEPIPLSYREHGDKNADVTVFNVRAAAFDKDGVMVGRIVTASYLFPKTPDRFTTKIVSVVTDPSNLYGKNGILDHRGLHGRESERPANVQFYTPEGVLDYQQDLGMRLNGAWARNMAQKNFRFFARKDYTAETAYLNYPLFPGLRAEKDGTQIETFDSFIIRGGATNFGNSMITSPIAYEMMENSAVDSGNFEAVTMFLNGKYYGVMMYLEDYDPYYFESHYGTDSDRITTIQYTIVGGNPLTNWEADDCTDAEFQEWKQVRRYIARHDMSKQEYYEVATSMIDTQNLIEYLVFNCYADNWDWPRNNQRIWRYNALPSHNSLTGITGGYDPDAKIGHDGRWRFVIKDLDISHGINAEPNLGYASDLHTDFFEVMYKDKGSLNDVDEIFDSLMDNAYFRRDFFLYVCEFLSSVADSAAHLERINTIALQVSKEMVYHHQIYEQSLDYYNMNLEDMREFALRRPAIIVANINDYAKSHRFDYQITTIEVLDFEGGTIQYNGVTLDGGGTLYTIAEKPIGFKLIPDPGYRLQKVETNGVEWNKGYPLIPKNGIKLRVTFVKDKDFVPKTETGVVMNEIGHSDLQRVNGSDWLELYNRGDSELSLKGYTLTCGTQSYTLPDITIPAGGFRVLFLSGDNRGGVYLPFKVSKGDTLTLCDADGRTIDRVTLLTKGDTAHLGRYPDGGEWVELSCYHITPNVPNRFDAAPSHYFSEQVMNTISVNSITLSPAIFGINEKGHLTVTRRALEEAEMPRSLALFRRYFNNYGADEVVDLHEWYEESQGKSTYHVYYCETLNTYFVYSGSIDLDSYDMPI